MMTRSRRLPFSWASFFMIALFLFGMHKSASAQYTWNQTTSGNWSTATWIGGTPVSGTTAALTFGGTTSYTATNDILNPFILNSMTFNNTNSGQIVTISSVGSSGLNFSGTNPNLTINSTDAAAVAITSNLTLSSATTFANYSSTGLLTVSGNIMNGANALTIVGAGATTISGSFVGTGSGGLTMLGSGTLTLYGANTYTGSTTIAGGNSVLDFTQATSPASNIISSSSALVLGGSALASGGKLTILGNGGSATIETFNGMTISAGSSSLVFTNSSGTPVVALGAITRSVVGGAIDFTLPAAGSITTSTAGIGSNFILGGYATVGGTTWAVSGVSGANPITALATASYVSPTATTATSDVDVTASATLGATNSVANSLRFNTGAAITLTLAGAASITSGGILMTSNVGNNAVTISGGTSLTSGNGKDLIVIQNNTSSSLTISTAITGSIGLTKAGAGNLNLTIVNTFTGNTVIDAGAITTGVAGGASTGVFGTSATATITVNQGATLTAGVFADSFGYGATRSEIIDGGAINGAAGAQRTTLSNLTFTGGALVIPSANSGDANGGAFSVGDFGQAITTNAAYTTATITGNGSGANITRSGSLSLQVASNTFQVASGFVTTGATPGVDLYISSVIGNYLNITGGIVKTGAGVMELAAANIFTGGVSVNAGTILLGNAQGLGLPTSAPLSFGASSAGTLILNGFGPTITGLNTNATPGAPVITNNSNTAATLTVNTTGSNTYAGVIQNGTGAGAVALTLGGGGSLTLKPSGAGNTYTGATTISNGTLNLDLSNMPSPTNAISASSTLTLGSANFSGTLGITGNAAGATAQTVASLNVASSNFISNIVLNPNGGSSTTLTITSNTATISAGASLNFNLSASTANATTSTLGNAIVAWNPVLSAGNFISTAYTVTDSGGTGFATVSSGNVIRYVPTNGLPASGAIGATDYVLNQNSTGTGGLNLTQTGNNSANTLTVNTTPTAGALTLNPSTTLQTSAIVFGGPNTFAIAGTGSLQALTSGGNLLLSNYAAGAVTIGAPIIDNSSASSLTINGTGTTHLAAANTYTGATALFSGGIVSIDNAQAFGMGTAAVTINPGVVIDANNGAAGAVVMSTNHTMTWSGSFTFAGSNNLNLGAGAVTLGAALTITTNGSSTLTVGGNISGATLGITKAGTGALALNGIVGATTGTVTVNAGTLILSGNNTYSGVTTVNTGGALQATTSTGALGTGTLTLAGGTLDLANNTGLSFGRNTTVSASSTITSDVLTSGNPGVTQALGTLSINASALTVTGGSNVGSGTAGLTFGAVTLSATGATITANNGPLGATLLTLASIGGATFGVTVGGTGNVNITGAITTTTGAFTKNSTGTVTVSGANTSTGIVTINNGILQLSGGGWTGATSTITVGANTNNATLAINNVNYTIGTTGGALNVGTTAGQTGVSSVTFLNTDTAVHTLTIASTTATNSITLGHATNVNQAVLNLNTSNTAADLITTGEKLAINAGGALINFTPLAGTTLANGASVTVLSYASSTVPTGLNLGSYTPGTPGQVYYLTATATAVTLNVAQGNTTGYAYWAGSQSTFAWNTNLTGGTSNWVTTIGGGTDALAPSSSTNVFFSATGATNLTTTLGQGFTINSLSFVSTSGAVSIASGSSSANAPLTITAAAGFTDPVSTTPYAAGTGIVVQSGAAAQAISAPIILGSSQSWTNNSASLLTISGGVTGLSPTANLTLNSTSTGGITIQTGAINNVANITNTSSAGTITISAVIGANVSTVTQNGSGSMLTLAGANLYTGSTVLTAGTLNINNATALGAAAATFVVNGGTFDNSTAAAISMTNANPQTWAGDFAFTGTKSLTFITGAITITNSTRNVTVNGSTLTEGGVIGDGGSGFGITKLGVGALALNGVSTYTGPTTITAGILSTTSIANGGAASGIGQSSNGAANLVLNGGTLQYLGASVATTDRLFTLSASSSIDASGTATNTLTFSNTGSVLFTGATGPVTLNLTGSQTTANIFNPLIADNTGGPFATSLAKTGAGSWTITNANTLSGGTTLSAGTLTVSDSTIYGAGAQNVTNNGFGSGSVTVSAGTLNLRNNGDGTTAIQTMTYSNSLIVNGTTATINVDRQGGTGTNKTLAFGGGTNLGAVMLTVAGTTADAYTLALGNTTLTATGGGTTTLSNVTATTAWTTLGSVTGSATTGFVDTLALGGTVTTTGNAITGVIADGSGGGKVAITNTDLWNLSSTGNTFTGAVAINGGTLTIASLADSSSASAAGISFGNAAAAVALVYTGSGETLSNRGITLSGSTGGVTINSSGAGALLLDGTFTNSATGATTLTLTGTNTGTNTIAGNLANSGANALSVTKTAVGSWTLAGTNTYTGNTVVSGGTLNLTGSFTGNGVAASGSTLAFGGTAGDATVNVSGTISTYYGFTGAAIANSVAVYNQTAGSFTSTSTNNTNVMNIVTSVANAYGYFNMTGGTFTAATGRIDIAPNGGTGVMYLSGTTLNPTTFTATGEWFIIGAYETGTGVGEVTVGPNATINHSGATAPIGITLQQTSTYGILNITGGTVITTTEPVTFGNSNGTINGVGFLNLASGTLSTGTAIVNNVGTGTGNNGYINFAGGTIKTTAGLAPIIPLSTAGQTITATIFGPITNSASSAIMGQIGTTQDFLGGLTVNTNTFASTITGVLNGASGNGVTQANITIPTTGNSGYIGAPSVTFNAPSTGDIPAAGYALISGGQVTGIVITSPGVYKSGDTPTITLSGGGGSIAAFTTSALTTANAADLGLTLTGGGSLTLSGANTYVGMTTVIGNSTLKAGASTNSAIPGSVTLGNASGTGTLDLNGFSPTITGLFVGSGATANSQLVGNSSAATNSTLTINTAASQSFGGIIQNVLGAGTKTTGLTLSGGGTLTLTNANTYTGGTAVQNGTLVLANGGALSSAANAGVVLGAFTTSGVLQFGNTTVGAVTQTLNQTNSTSVLSANSITAGTNSVVGGAPNGGIPANNSVLTLNIGTGFTDLYQGSIGGTGTYQNNINLMVSGGGTLELNQNLTNWTGAGSGPTDPTRPTLTVNSGVLQLDTTATINTAVIINNGGIFNNQGATGPNFSLTFTGTSGVLLTISTVAGSFESAGVTSSALGVAALNIPNNTGVVDYASSAMYLGAVGARVYAGTSLTPTSTAIGYQFGGGGNWGALATTLVGGGGYLQVASANVVTGNYNVTIGNNGTYNSGLGLYGGASTVEFTAAQNFVGNLILAGGSFAFTNVNQFGNAANSVVFSGGNLLYDSGNTTDVSARLSLGVSYMVGATTFNPNYTIDTGGNNITFATALTNTGGALGGLSKLGSGALTLAATTPNSYTGNTTIYNGTLKLDMNAAGINNIISTSSPLQLFGGTLAINGHGSTTQNSQSFASTTIGDNAFSVISPSFSAATSGSGNQTIGLGTLSRTSGATAQISFGTNATAANSPITASGLTANTLITASSVPYLIVGTTDWAAGNAGGTAIVGGSTLTGFYTTMAAAGSGAVTSSENGNMTGGGTFTITAGAGTSSLASLNYSSGATTPKFQIGTGASDLLQIGGVLVGSAAKSGTAAPQIAGGGLGMTSLSSGGDITFFILNGAYTDGSTTQYFQNAAKVVDNGSGHTGVTINGGNNAGLYYPSVATSTYSGVTTLTGGAGLDLSAGAAAGIQPNTASPIGQNSGAASYLVVNNGVLYNNNGAVVLNRDFTMGLGGATLQADGAGTLTINGTAGATQIALQDFGSRTLTLTGGATGVNTLALSIVDQGGPTSLVKTFTNAGTANTGTAPWVLSGTNSYTGTTTISGGELQLASATALPGGLGALSGSTSPTNTGGNNLIFASAVNTNAVLELTSASGNFYRPVGTGFDQVSWTSAGGGGFAANGTNMTVNLDGATTPTTLVWGSTTGFVNTGNLVFGGAQATAAISFQNGLDLNGAARTVEVDRPTAAGAIGAYQANITSAIINSSGTAATFTKTSNGALELSSSTQGTGTVNVTVSAGYLGFTNATTAVPGAGSGRTVTVNVNAGVVLVGAADPTPLMSRIVQTSAGSISLDTSSSAAINFTGFTSGLTLGTFSSPGGTPIYFNGTITPATISGTPTYRFGNAVQAAPNTSIGSAATAIQADTNLLVLNGQNMLSGTSAAAFNGQGPIYVTGANTFSGGTTIVESIGATTNQVVGLGNDAALGVGAVNIGGAGGFISSINADRVLSNNITSTGLAATNVLVNGNLASDNVVNVGAITFLGAFNDSTQTTGGFFTRAGTSAIFLGNVITNSSNQWALNTGTFELLTTPAGAVSKTLSGSAGKGIGLTTSGVSLIIDSAASLGTAPTSTVANFISITNPAAAGTFTIGLLPGAGAVTPVTLGATEGITIGGANVATTMNIPGGPLTGNSNLVIQGVIAGAGGVFTKSGLGTLTLEGANTFTGGVTVTGGSLVLNFANSTATSILASQALTLGLASGAYSNGGALQIISGATTAVSQTIGNVTLTGKGTAITLISGGAPITLTIGALTQTNGNPMVAFTVPTGSAINSSTAINDNGGLIAYASYNGSNFASVSGGSIVAYSNYTVLSGPTPTISSSATSNVQIDSTSTGNPTVSGTSTLLNTLKYSDTNARTINIGTGNTLSLGGTGGGDSGYVGTVLSASGAGALTIGVAGSAGSLSAGTVTNNAAVLHFMNYSSNPILVNAAIVNNGTGAVNPTIDAGVVTFAGANTFTGNFLIENGATLNYNDGSAAGKSLGNLTAGAGNILLNGGTLGYVGSATSNNLIYGITSNAPSAFNIPTGDTVTQTAQGITGLANIPGILKITGGGTLTLSGATDDPNASIEVGSGSTLNLGKTSAAAVHSVSGNAGGAALIIDSGGFAVVTGTGANQIYDGSSVIANGTFDLKGSSQSFDGLAGASTGVVTTSTGTSTLTLGGATANTNNLLNIGPNTLNAALAGVGSTGLNNYSGTITGAISLVKNGSGNETLSSLTTLTYTGTTTINAGSLIMGAANVLPTTTAVTIAGNTVINGLTVPGNLNLGGYSLKIGSLNSTTGGTVTDTPTLSNNGTAWGTTVGGAFSTSATSGADTLTLGNGNLSGSFNGVLQNGYTVIPVAGSGAGTLVTGILALTKTGTGIQTLAGLNTYSGATTVTNGTLMGGAAGAFSAVSAVTVTSPGILDLGGFNQTIFSLQGNGLVYTSGSNAATLTIVNGSGLTFSGALQNDGVLSMILSTGLLQLSGTNNTYTGTTTVNNGATLQGVAAGSNFAAASPVILNGTGTLDLGGGNQTILSLSSASQTSSVTNSGASSPAVLSIVNSTNSAISTVYAGTIVNGTSATGLTLSSTGSSTMLLQLSNAAAGNTYSGPTTVNANSTLQVGAPSVLSPNSDVTLNGNGTLDLVGSFWAQQVLSLSSTSSTSLVAASGNSGMPTLTIAGTTTSANYVTATSTVTSTFAGSIGGNAGLTLDASINNVNQSLLLTGTSTTTGAVYVQGTAANTSTLIVNGALGTTLAGGLNGMGVNLGGVLAGIGTVNSGGTVAVGPGGVIRGGVANGTNNYGALTVNMIGNNLTISGSGTTQSTMGTIVTEINRTNTPSSMFNQFGLGTATTGAGNNSLIVVGGASGQVNLAPTAGMSPGSYVGNIQLKILDTNSSLVVGESYTINLVQATGGTSTTSNFYLNGLQISQANFGSTWQQGPGGVTILDQGTGALNNGATPTMGTYTAGSFTTLNVQNNASFANSSFNWVLQLDGSSNFLQLSITSGAVPEPHHILMIAAGALCLGLAIRRRAGAAAQA
jgi:fibronectin-binding autotransporter adhesin